MRFAAFVLFLVFLAGAWTPAGAASEPAGRRVALVVGNGDYRQVPALANPRHDAEAMAAALRRLGFEVELGVDLDLQGMRRVVQAFSRRLEGSDVALFFYAGHGMQVYGQNYLLPIDASLETEADLDFSAIPARLVLGQMERWPGVKIVMLDACRDNPFASTLTRAMGASRAARALSRGLAPIETAGGTLLAYATDPGDVAADGEGRHSPFTAALLKHVEEPSVEINTMLARVRAEVYTSTGRRQRPWTETSLIGEFYMAPEPEPAPVQVMMAPQPAPAPPSSGMDPRTIELALWGAAQAGGTVADYQEYLRQYPEGIFAGIARNRIAVLEADAVRVAPGAPGETSMAEAGPPSAGPGAAGVANTPPPAAETPPVPTGERGNAGGEVVAAPSGDAGTGAAAPDVAAPGDTLAMLPQTGQHAPRPPVPGAPAVGPDPAAREAALRLGQAERRAVQARLLLAGHDPRGVDGIFGPGTRAAVSAWQGAQGLAATGYLDGETLERLERATEAAYAAWVERQTAEAQRAAADRARAAETAAARAASQATAVRSTPTAPAPADAPPPISTLAPMPTAPVAPPPSTPTATTAPPASAETREQECYHVWTGSTTLERRCVDAPTGAARLGRRK